jgi:hypothetical protein
VKSGLCGQRLLGETGRVSAASEHRSECHRQRRLSARHTRLR